MRFWDVQRKLVTRQPKPGMKVLPCIPKLWSERVVQLFSWLRRNEWAGLSISVLAAIFKQFRGGVYGDCRRITSCWLVSCEGRKPYHAAEPNWQNVTNSWSTITKGWLRKGVEMLVVWLFPFRRRDSEVRRRTHRVVAESNSLGTTICEVVRCYTAEKRFYSIWLWVVI